MTETPRGTGHTNTNRRNWETGGQALDDDVVGGQQKQSPEEGIPEGGPIPLHRDTTIYIHIHFFIFPSFYFSSRPLQAFRTLPMRREILSGFFSAYQI